MLLPVEAEANRCEESEQSFMASVWKSNGEHSCSAIVPQASGQRMIFFHFSLLEFDGGSIDTDCRDVGGCCEEVLEDNVVVVEERSER